MLSRLFPRQIDNRFDGYRAALWLLGLLIALKLVVSVNSIVNTQAVAVGADGFPLDRFGPEAARAVLMLFALSALGQLVLAVIGTLALIRYRAMVPLLYLLSLGEMLARRLLIQSYAVERTGDSPIGAYMTYGILALLALGLLLSLLPRRRGSTIARERDSA